MPSAFPSLVLPDKGSTGAPRLGHPLVDDYLASVAARLRPNSTLAVAYDLKVFFTVVTKNPMAVRASDVVAFVGAQRTQGSDGTVVRLEEGSTGLAVSTVRRRLSSVSSFYRHLVLVGEVPANPVQRGMPVRSPVTRNKRVVPLVRPVRHLPRVLDPAEVNALLGGLRTERDRAIVEAMLLAGLRRSEALGLRLDDVRWGERRLFIADGKGGHQRLVPISPRFFTTLRVYFDRERPADAVTDRLFVVLKGPHRGRPLTARVSRRSSPAPVDGPGSPTGPVTSCGTLASPASARPAWRWKPCRPRRGTGRSARPRSTCIWPTTGWPASTGEPPKPSTPKATSAGGDGSHDRAGDRTRTHRPPVGSHQRACAGAGGDVPSLPGPDRRVAAARQRGRRRRHVAAVRQLARRPPPRRACVASGAASSHRGLQAMAGHPRGPDRAAVEEDHHQPAARDAAGDHRTAHRMGSSRLPGPEPDLRHRLAPSRRAAPQVPRRRPGCPVHGRRHPPRSLPSPRHRNARPHRPTRRRVLRPPSRRHRRVGPDPLAAGPGRQAPHRPLHPPPPHPARPPRRLAGWGRARRHRPAHHQPRPTARPLLRGSHPRPVRPHRRHRPRPPPPAAPHPGYPGHQPGHEPGSHRRHARPPLHTHDPRLRPHRRPHRRRPVLRRRPTSRRPLHQPLDNITGIRAEVVRPRASRVRLDDRYLAGGPALARSRSGTRTLAMPTRGVYVALRRRTRMPSGRDRGMARHGIGGQGPERR